MTVRDSDAAANPMNHEELQIDRMAEANSTTEAPSHRGCTERDKMDLARPRIDDLGFFPVLPSNRTLSACEDSVLGGVSRPRPFRAVARNCIRPTPSGEKSPAFQPIALFASFAFVVGCGSAALVLCASVVAFGCGYAALCISAYVRGSSGWRLREALVI